MAFPHLNDDEVQEAGGVMIACPECGLALPVPVLAFFAIDDDGDRCLFAEPCTVEYEAHLMAHCGLSGEVPDGA